MGDDVEIEKLSLLAEEKIRSRLSMYWGKESPNLNDAECILTDQINCLGIDGILKNHVGNWRVVGAKGDWIKSGLDLVGSIEHLFKLGSGFPQAGDNSLRCEFLIYHMVRDLVLWNNNVASIIKGKPEKKETDGLFESYYDYVAIAFRGNCYVTEPSVGHPNTLR